MADASRPRTEPSVIPLYPVRTAPRRFPRLPRILSKAAVRMGGGTREALGFLAPALFLATGAALLAMVAGGIAAGLELWSGSPATLAAVTGKWTLLAAAGAALARRGVHLARLRWK